MMSEKRFYCDDVGEYRNYAIFDTSKCEKSKEDFYDIEEECYDLMAFEDYLLENDCILLSDDVVDLLNALYEENKRLKEEIKAYPINKQYAEEIIKQNKKLRIERNHLRRENEQLKKENGKYRVMINANASLNDEVYEQLKKIEKRFKECREENEYLKEFYKRYLEKKEKEIEKHYSDKRRVITRKFY